MRSTNELRAEHEGIQVMLDVIEAVCDRIGSPQPAGESDLQAIMEFLRVFVDRCHHAKEEDLLFPALEAVGVPREGGPIGAMLAEHEQGRGLIRSMVDGLGTGNPAAFVAHARAYVDLLRTHIDKENQVLFVMADSVLSSSVDEELFEGFEAIEREHIGAGKHEEFHALLEALAHRYRLS